jgi:DNA uptake protein ComE-like DNA-binding protein
MKKFVKAALVVVSLLVSAGLAGAADVKAPVPDVKGTVKALKSDAAAGAATAKENVKGKAADAKAAVKGKIVDINSATDAELKAIPGIGDAFAAKILAGRPYANKTQLKSRNIIPANVYEQVKDLIVAKQKK